MELYEKLYIRCAHAHLKQPIDRQILLSQLFPSIPWDHGFQDYNHISAQEVIIKIIFKWYKLKGSL